jgi:hypothetical protein
VFVCWPFACLLGCVCGVVAFVCLFVCLFGCVIVYCLIGLRSVCVCFVALQRDACFCVCLFVRFTCELLHVCSAVCLKLACVWFRVCLVVVQGICKGEFCVVALVCLFACVVNFCVFSGELRMWIVCVLFVELGVSGDIQRWIARFCIFCCFCLFVCLFRLNCEL